MIFDQPIVLLEEMMTLLVLVSSGCCLALQGFELWWVLLMMPYGPTLQLNVDVKHELHYY